MSYTIVFSSKAKPAVEKLKKTGSPAYKKLQKLLPELQEHPRTGTAHPEPLVKGNDSIYSRRLTAHDRLIYHIFDNIVQVTIISTEGHYNDK